MASFIDKLNDAGFNVAVTLSHVANVGAASQLADWKWDNIPRLVCRANLDNIKKDYAEARAALVELAAAETKALRTLRRIENKYVKAFDNRSPGFVRRRR